MQSLDGGQPLPPSESTVLLARFADVERWYKQCLAFIYDESESKWQRMDSLGADRVSRAGEYMKWLLREERAKRFMANRAANLLEYYCERLASFFLNPHLEINQATCMALHEEAKKDGYLQLLEETYPLQVVRKGQTR